MKNKVSPQQTTYQLHVSLFGISPPVDNGG